MSSFQGEHIPAGAPDAATRGRPTEETNAAGVTGRCRRWGSPAWPVPAVGMWVLALAGLLAGQDSPAQEMVFYSPGSPHCADGAARDASGSERLGGIGPPTPFGCTGFYVDYRIRRLDESHTSYAFGTIDPTGPNPLSRLEFPINGTWTGLELGLEGLRWAVRAEWVTPVNGDIHGQFEDRDWLLVGQDFTDLGVSEERWIDAQMLDVAFEIDLFELRLGLPISVRPVGGFRWQKFDLMAFNAKQLKEFDMWVPDPVSFEGDVIRFRQEYYHYYVGGQLRTDVDLGGLLPTVRLTFQGDWAGIQGFNFDHHLLREGVLIGRENTHGDGWHIGGAAEIFLSERFSVGIEGEYTQIRTTGRHHDTNVPLGWDATWTRGVHVWSDQTAISVFLRLRS